MQVAPIKTRLVHPPQDEIWDIFESIIPQLQEKSIVAISSKIVSIHQGRCLPKHEVPNKDLLIQQEADQYIPRELSLNQWVLHTIKNNVLIPTAGIDESNADGHYVLWPERLKETAEEFRSFLQQKSGLTNLGVILVDSHSVPLRRGVVGIALSYAGFAPLHDYRGSHDLFGHTFRVSQTNFPDSLASAAVLVMGEGAEQTPLAILTDLPATLQFGDHEPISDKPYSQFEVPIDEDLYAPFLKSVPWKRH